MKYIKSYKLYENLNSKLISKLEEFGIENYIINNDESIDVNGNVNIAFKGLAEIPFCFNKIEGIFVCGYNHLTSLKGCPSEIGKDFNCSYNQLESLEHCSLEIGKNFQCSNNKLTSLKGCPSEIGGYFDCSNNQLQSLEYCPSEIGGNFYCHNNQLTMLDCSSYIKGDIYCWGMFGQEPEFFGDCEGKIDWKR